MLIASMTFIMPGPMMAATATASSTPGKANTTSRPRMMKAVPIRPVNAATSPSTRPATELSTMGATAVGIETRPPQMMRLSTSRPWPSVPSG